MSSATLLHLSDVHLGADDRPLLWENFSRALSKVASEATGPVAVAVTGDLIDTPTARADELERLVRGFVGRIASALAAAGHAGAPIVLLPGNHDRRADGVMAPWRHRAMRLITEWTAGAATVVAADEHQPLATCVRSLEQVLGMNVVAYDSTHTVAGFISAGGLIRVEDLLAVSIHMNDRPTLVLTHHHLVPTPVTDVGVTDTRKKGLLKRVLVGAVLPRAVSFGDREELFMTALGAGTGLSALAALERPVVVLHGHKHYPTARLMAATTPRDGDVLIASAGSLGLLEPFSVTGREPDDEPASDTSAAQTRRLYLWPSFNVLTFNDGVRLDISTCFFKPDLPSQSVPQTQRQALAAVQRQGRRWVPRTRRRHRAPYEKVIDRDEAVYALTSAPGGYWTATCTRLVVGGPDATVSEPIDPLARAQVIGDGYDERHGLFAFPRGVPSSYALERGVFRTVAERARRARADHFSPFESVGLIVRRGAQLARLEVRGLGPSLATCFASRTDLHTGEVRPLRLDKTGGAAIVELRECPARRLIRIHWRLEAG